MKFSRVILDELKERIDLPELIESYGVELKKSGVRYAGLCPFHNERSPSFSVNPVASFFHCFGCGEGGDAFAFVQKMDHCSFQDSVILLADKVGYNLPVIEETDEEKKEAEDRKQLYSLMEESARWLHENFMPLPRNHPAKAELNSEKRQLGSQELCEEFEIGYAPEGWDKLSNHLLSKGYKDDLIVLSGMGVKTKKGNIVDRFRGRVTWTIRDIQGRAVGFGARKLYDTDDGAKYLNSPETPIYKKNRTLYNLERARKAIVSEGYVIVVEGYTDIMACWDAGVYNVVASSGTAFSDEHIGVLRRLLDGYEDGRVGQIVFSFDGDSAGQKAARKTLDLDTPLQSRSYVVTIPENMDPCDFRAKHSNEELKAVLVDPEKRVPLVDFVLANEAKNHDIRNTNGRIAYLSACIPILKKIREQELRIQATRRVSYYSGVQTAQVEDFLRQEYFVPETVLHEIGVNPQNSSPLESVQKRILAAILQYPDFLPFTEQAGLTGEDFITEKYQIAYYESLGFITQRRVNPSYMPNFCDEDLMRELFNLQNEKPSENTLLSLILSLKQYHADEERKDALRRLEGVTEQGYQGVTDTSFQITNEIAQMNIDHMEEEEKQAALRQKMLSKKNTSQQVNRTVAETTLNNILQRVKSQARQD